MRHLTYKDRNKIEFMYNHGYAPKEIARDLGVHFTTIYKEIQKGLYNALDSEYRTITRYSSDKAQARVDFNNSSKGKNLKIGNDFETLKKIEYLIKNRKYSPQAALTLLKQKGELKTEISYNTIYRYIDQGLFPTLKRSDLPHRPKRKRKQRKTSHVYTDKKAPIEMRPIEAINRLSFGHWEIDTVIGKKEKGQTLITLTERLTNYCLVYRSKDKSWQSTLEVFQKIKAQFGDSFREIFKTITCDNGTEFSTSAQWQKENLPPSYYCHPYCSSERGQNEKNNGMLRRWFPKSTKIEDYTDQYIQDAQEWLNTYPRPMYNNRPAVSLVPFPA